MLDFILHINQHLIALAAQYGIWIYAILFIIVFCETGLVVTPFLPGDSLLFAAGAVAAASAGALNVHLIVAVLLAAAVLGDASNFEIGKYFGAKLFSRPDSKIFKPEYLAKTHAFYEKYGGKTIILARFVPIVRTFAPKYLPISKLDASPKTAAASSTATIRCTFNAPAEAAATAPAANSSESPGKNGVTTKPVSQNTMMNKMA